MGTGNLCKQPGIGDLFELLLQMASLSGLLFALCGLLFKLPRVLYLALLSISFSSLVWLSLIPPAS